MPELHQILGSLFADIAQSVFTSDLYSRDISRYYEQDGLLRHFPVPRTEISELDLNLKFAISDIELNPVQGIEREANAATVFLDFTYTLSEAFYEELHNSLVEFSEQHRPISTGTLQQAASGVNSIYLRQDLLRFFQRQHGSLIEDGTFQTDKAREEILEILRKRLYSLVDEELDDKEKKDLLERVNKEIHLDANLKALAEPLRVAWNRAGDFRMDVEITAEKLGELDTQQLSSVQVRTRVRNYKWSQVEHEGGHRWWTLHPE
jgi:hypothetical protein